MIQKKNGMEQAKLARAYVRGGLPPYQAARKCGFLRVSLMEEAISELDAYEKNDEADKKPVQETDNSAYLKKAQITFDTKPPVLTKLEPKQFYKPLQNWRNEKASVSYYGANDSLAPMYKLSLEGNNRFLIIPETSIKDVASLLCEAAGLNGPESNDTSNPGRIAELEAELEATKAELTYLKLKMFDKLMAMV